ncbi:MAG: N-acetyltransferase [Nitrospirota bacterium]
MIRKAKISDAKKIHELINYYAKKELMLYRSLNDIYENIRDFSIYEGKKGDVLGACALHIGWEGMGEIRSLAVKQGYTKKGIGKDLVEGILREASEFGIKTIFVLTYIPNFFKKIGFKEIDKKKLPQKVWTECVNCPKFPDCDETAMIYKRN